MARVVVHQDSPLGLCPKDAEAAMRGETLGDLTT